MGRHLAAVLCGLIGVSAAAAALTAAPARAVTGTQTGNLSLTTASGAARLQPRWHTRPRPVATTTTLTASPDPAAASATVTLTATVKAADGTIPRGEVAFVAGFTLISVAAVNSDTVHRVGKPAGLDSVSGGVPAGVTPGPPVAPADPGPGTTAAVLASAEEGSGFGTYVLSASVVLDIPPMTAGGPYGGSLTITAVEAGP